MAKVLVRERHSAPPLHAEGSRRERGTVLSEEEEESVWAKLGQAQQLHTE